MNGQSSRGQNVYSFEKHSGTPIYSLGYFRQSYVDYSLFTYSSCHVFLYVLIYVDDVIVTGNASSTINRFKQDLSTCFYMTDLGVLNYSLSIEFARNASSLCLNPHKYTVDIIF